jgi:hypothetical protein
MNEKKSTDKNIRALFIPQKLQVKNAFASRRKSRGIER